MQAGFFLGANSKHGFYSLYDDLLDLERATAVYIIKGSPGCGKSSFMRRVMNKMLDAGLAVEQIFCSSDPGSLDAIIIPALGAAFVDGTAPHVVEPRFPLAVEQYLNLGTFADVAAIRAKKEDILHTTKRYHAGFDGVYRLLNGAAALESELFDLALGGISVERLRKKAAGIIAREIRGHGAGGEKKRRFLSAISPDGCVTLFDTIPALAENIFVLEDQFGLGMFLLQPILDAALDAGYDAYAAYSPLMPERLEHVIIPELSLAFVTSKKSAPYPGAYKRRIRIDAMIDPDILRQNKKKIAFSRKLSASMCAQACGILHENKRIHDQIEAFYNPHIDFDGVYHCADALAAELLRHARQGE